MRHVVGVIGHVMAPGLKPGFHQAQDVGIQSVGTVVLLASALEQSLYISPVIFANVTAK